MRLQGLKQYLKHKYSSFETWRITAKAKRDFLERRKRYKNSAAKVDRIAVVYFVPNTNKEKYLNWSDGFTAAMKLLEQKYHIHWINLHDKKPTAEELNEYDFLIVKSCWDWIVDRYIRGLEGLKTKRGIAISCSKPPHSEKAAWFYDVLWYENDLYKEYLKNYPNKIKAFGVNTDVFKPADVTKDIDALTIGAFAPYKRLHLLNDLEGKRKIIIGDANTQYSEEIKKLLNPDIEIIDYVSQNELAIYINRSKMVFVPFEEKGGGERCVLEAMACQTPIRIMDDNKELQYLARQRVLSHYDYADALEKGLKL